MSTDSERRSALKILRGFAFLFALALSAAALTVSSEPVQAWGLIETETFYSDATYSHIVGRCVENSCTGSYSCTGQITEFSKTTFRYC